MDTNTNEVIERGMRRLWLIWSAILGSLLVYVFICHQLGDELRANVGPNFPLGTFRNILYIITIITLFLTYFFRKFMLSGKVGKSEVKVPAPGLFGSQTPFLSKYTTAIIVSLALSESIGIYGLVLFFLGGNFQTLYVLIGISALSMFYYRPKREEIEKLSLATKSSERTNQSTYDV
ncbi:MAG: hypothetical protein JRJ29_18245 [Deltaproteobacteria bacterium]|nr:hypothetical protein [Deltaproteobacteria bacterium]